LLKKRRKKKRKLPAVFILRYQTESKKGKTQATMKYDMTFSTPFNGAREGGGNGILLQVTISYPGGGKEGENPEKYRLSLPTPTD